MTVPAFVCVFRGSVMFKETVTSSHSLLQTFSVQDPELQFHSFLGLFDDAMAVTS